MVIPLRDLNPTTRRPVVTLLLIIVNVVVFVFIQPRGATTRTEIIEENRFLYENAAIPCEITQGEPLTEREIGTQTCVEGDAVSPAVIASPERFPDKNVYLAILTSMFLHGGFAHLGFNMLFLWVFGNNVEDRLGPFGFAAFYVVAGVAAMLAQVALGTGSVAPVIGASGAIAGVMGAYLIFWPHARIFSLLLFFPVALPASFVLLFWLGMQFLTAPDSGIAWGAHVGGFVAGVLLALVLAAVFRWPTPWRNARRPPPAPPGPSASAPPPFGRGGGGPYRGGPAPPPPPPAPRPRGWPDPDDGWPRSGS